MNTHAVSLPAKLTHGGLLQFRDHVLAAPSGSIIVIHGATDDVFCEGLALGALAAVSPTLRDEGLDAFSDAIWALLAGPNPCIAEVTGRAIGGGFGIAAACDVVIATPRATFGLPEPLFGLIPGLITPIIRQRVSSPTLRRLAIRGESMDAQTALSLGVADAVVGGDVLEKTVRGWVRRLARAHPPAVGRLKTWLGEMDDIRAQMDVGKTHMRELLSDPHVMQRVAAFEAGLAPWEV